MRPLRCGMLSLGEPSYGEFWQVRLAKVWSVQVRQVSQGGASYGWVSYGEPGMVGLASIRHGSVRPNESPPANLLAGGPRCRIPPLPTYRRKDHFMSATVHLPNGQNMAHTTAKRKSLKEKKWEGSDPCGMRGIVRVNGNTIARGWLRCKLKSCDHCEPILRDQRITHITTCLADRPAYATPVPNARWNGLRDSLKFGRRDFFRIPYSFTHSLVITLSPINDLSAPCDPSRLDGLLLKSHSLSVCTSTPRKAPRSSASKNWTFNPAKKKSGETLGYIPSQEFKDVMAKHGITWRYRSHNDFHEYQRADIPDEDLLNLVAQEFRDAIAARKLLRQVA